VELIETSTFTRQITSLLSDEEYVAFNPALPRIRNSARSSEVVVGYARSASLLDREGRVAARASSTIGRYEET
jgi:hypothetical protein